MKIPRGNGVNVGRNTAWGVQSAATQQQTSILSGALQMAGQWKDQKDHADTIEAVNAATKMKNDWKAQNLQREGKAAEGLTEEYIKFTQDVDSQLSKNLSGVAKEKFRSWHTDDTERDRVGVMMHQKKQDDFVKASALNDGLNTTEEMIRQDARNFPKAFEHAELNLKLGLDAGVIPPEQYEQKRTEVLTKLRNETGKNYYAQDKHEFIKKIDQFGFGEPEKAAYLDRYQRDVLADQRELKNLNAEEAKLIMSQADDMKAQAVANNDTSYLKENAAKLTGMGFKDWGERLQEEAATHDAVIAFNEGTKGKKLSEKIAEAKALKVGDDLDESSIELKSKRTIEREMAKQVKLFHADPAQYVSPGVHADDPELRAENMLSLQKAEGITPAKGYKVLPMAESNQLKAAWESGNSRDKTQLLKEQFKYGKHTGKVIKEMGLNSALSLSTHFEDDRDIELAVAALDEKNPIIIDDVKKSEYVSAAKESNVYQVLATAQSKLPTSGLSKNIQDIQKLMVGVSALKVDSKAGKDFLDGKFNTIDEGDKAIFFSSRVDEDEIEDALNKKKESVLNSTKDTGHRRAYREHTIWANTESGFALFDQRSGRAIPGSEVSARELDPVGDKINQERKQKALVNTKLPNDRVTQTFVRGK